MMQTARALLKNERILFSIVIVALLVALFAALRFSPARERLWPKQDTEAVPTAYDASFLKIGFVSDWEYGDNARLKHKLTNRAPLELAKVVKYFNATFQPDVVVGGGDYIESSNVKPEKAKTQLHEISQVFEKLSAPYLYALGNHDLRSLSKADVRAILGISDNHAIYDVGDWRLVIVDTNFTAENTDRSAESYITGHFSPQEKAWLETALRTDRPVIVFGHQSPLIIPNGKGSGFIQNIDNVLELRAVLEAARNVVAFVAGHNTMSYYEERNGIHYFVVDTLVREKALGSFATIEARYVKERRYAEIRFRQHGLNKVSFIIDRTLGETGEDNLLPEHVSVPNVDAVEAEED